MSSYFKKSFDVDNINNMTSQTNNDVDIVMWMHSCTIVFL